MGIKRKLSSNSGASIVFALAIFLISTIISLTLITISVTSAKTSSIQLEDEQAYLAVSSAARLFVSAMGDTELKARQTATDGNLPEDYFEGATFYKGTDPSNSETLLELDNALINYLGDGDGTTFSILSPDTNLKYDVEVKIRKVDSNKDLIEDDASPYVFIAEFASKKKEGIAAKGSYRTSMCFYPYITQVTHYKAVTDGTSNKNVVDNRDTIVTWDIFKDATGESKGD